jgi:hypothetical protein
MHNLTRATANERMLSFVNKEQDGAILFVADKYVAVPRNSEDYHELLRGWFLWLDDILRKIGQS